MRCGKRKSTPRVRWRSFNSLGGPKSNTREVRAAAVRGLQVKIATPTSRRFGLKTQLADSVNRWGLDMARALKAVSESAVAISRARGDWVRNHDAEVARLRAELVATRAKDRTAANAEIGEATKDALHTVDESVHADRQEKQKLTKAHWIPVRDRKVHEVRDQSRSQSSPRFVGGESEGRRSNIVGPGTERRAGSCVPSWLGEAPSDGPILL